MEINDYIPRLMDGILKRNLELYGAVSLEGCKWCGKSTTARRVAKSMIEMQNLTTAENNKSIAKSDPAILLEGEKPRLIDRWGAIEIKLGTDEISINEGLDSLKKFTENINTDIMRKPSFLIVLTAATNYAYRTDDGVFVVPIGCLKD